MLAKSQRLKSNKSINYLFKNGQHSKSDHFFYKYSPSNLKLKIAASIVKKFKLSKPEKNRLRRQILNACKQILNQNPELQDLNFNLMIVLHTIPTDKSRYELFVKEISKKLNQLNHE